jgi:hypothetical protein
MLKIKPKSHRLFFMAFVFLFVLAGVHFLFVSHAQSVITATTNTPNSSATFHYGFDFTDQEPDLNTQDLKDAGIDPNAVASAKQVLSTFGGSYMDQSIYGFGASKDPEPSLGIYNTASIDPRISLITGANGVPVISLVQAPAWMHPSTTDFSAPPDPTYYQDFADLCAHIAQTYPHVQYFTVWSEMRGFYKYDSTNFGAAEYTTMYNDVYNSVKAVRPDAKVGGPYAAMSSEPTAALAKYTGSTLHGPWGYTSAVMQNGLSYWLSHKTGADYVAVDGATEIAKASDATVTDPVTAAGQYAAVDSWIKSQTNLPIWWMESHIAPATGWSDKQGAAARIATLIMMSSSGTSVGMQWQPQDQHISINGAQAWPDEGLWTSTLNTGGGQPTTLGSELPAILPQISQPLTIVNGQPAGVLVAENATSAILVNTNSGPVEVTVNGVTTILASGDVKLQSLSSSPGGSSSTNPPGGGTTPNAIAQSTSANGVVNNVQSGSSSTSLASKLESVSNGNSKNLTYTFDTKNVVKAEYYLDSKLLTTITKSPYEYTLNTAHILNGQYTYKVKVYYSTGQTKISSSLINVKNPDLTEFSLVAQKYTPEVIVVIFILIIVELFILKNPFRHHIRKNHSLPITKMDNETLTTPSIIVTQDSAQNNTPSDVNQKDNL